MMLLILACLALNPACGPREVCTIDGGLEVEDLDAWECGTFKEHEARVVADFAKEFHMTEYTVRLETRGWTMRIRRTGPWFDPGVGYEVSGLTSPDERLVELATVDWKKSAFAHELVHVLEETHWKKSGPEWGCSADETKDRASRDHCSWERRGIWQAIERAVGK